MTDPTAPPDLSPALARSLSLPPRSVRAALDLFEAGHTVPFVARYRKEATGELDEVQLRAIQDGHAAQVDLEKRRAAIVSAIEEQGQLSPGLRARLVACGTKAELEDIYLPFKRKRKTRASQARERGLEPLAKRIREQPERGDPAREAAPFVDAAKEVASAQDALAGARDIVAEEVAEDPAVRALAREALTREGLLVSTAARKKKADAAKEAQKDGKEKGKFDGYLDYREPVARVPSHRVLAVLRGEKEGALSVKLTVDEERLLPRVLGRVNHRPRSPFAGELAAAVADGWSRLLHPSLETEVRSELEQRAHLDAVTVFGQNLRPKLLAPPMGARPVVGVDPGLRTGCKCAAVDASGAYRGQVTIYPGRGPRESEAAARDLVAFVRTHLGPALAKPAPGDSGPPAAVAVGNGTAGRETEAFVRDALKAAGLGAIPVVSVDEAGASVYSASDLARAELPDLDITIRGAVSIARRLQDPLAELVKIDPRSIGVGQYQHDVDAALLEQKLGEVVESCVNQVGVDLETASAPLLAHVSGIGPKLAQKVVAHREEHGAFGSRAKLKQVPGIGPRTFEQCAGFIRVRGGHPLDASAVHPERYALVERMAKDLDVPLAKLVGDRAQAARIDLSRYVSPDVGEPTLRDIVAELAAPGRDPRDRFEPPKFRDDVRELEDLKPGLQLEGVVTNVVAFGAFVDVGVHQDGLIHVSELADKFVKDPHEVVHVGQRLSVRVLSVDLDRRRIGLSARTPRAPAR